MFENKTYEGIYYSRFAASWFGDRKTDWMYHMWLKNLIINGKPIPDDVIQEIVNFGTNGKLELETHAKLFKSNLDQAIKEYIKNGG